MYDAIIRGLDLTMESQRSLIVGHVLIFNPKNTPKQWEGRSSNQGAQEAFNCIVTNLRPRHNVSPGDATSIHRHNADSWVLKCLETWPQSLYARLARYCHEEISVGGYSLSFRLTSFDVELRLGKSSCLVFSFFSFLSFLVFMFLSFMSFSFLCLF